MRFFQFQVENLGRHRFDLITFHFQATLKMISRITQQTAKRLRQTAVQNVRCMSDRPEPQQTDSLLQIGSRRIYDSTHDGK